MTALAPTLEMTTIEDLYRAYGPALLRRARAVLGNETAAEDAMQEVFAKAIHHRHHFRREASPKTWLYRVTTNYCLNLKRNGHRQRRLLEEKVMPVMPTSDWSMDAKVGARDLMGRVPEPLRQVAACFYLEGMTQDETAEALGISRRTVGNRLKSFRDLAHSPRSRTRRR